MRCPSVVSYRRQPCMHALYVIASVVQEYVTSSQHKHIGHLTSSELLYQRHCLHKQLSSLALYEFDVVDTPEKAANRGLTRRCLFVELNNASHADNPFVVFAPQFRFVFCHNSTMYRCGTIHKNWILRTIAEGAQFGPWSVVNETL